MFLFTKRHSGKVLSARKLVLKVNSYNKTFRKSDIVFPLDTHHCPVEFYRSLMICIAYDFNNKIVINQELDHVDDSFPKALIISYDYVLKCEHCDSSTKKHHRDIIFQLSCHEYIDNKQQSIDDINQMIALTFGVDDVPEFKCEKCTKMGFKRQIQFETHPDFLLFDTSKTDNMEDYTEPFLGHTVYKKPLMSPAKIMSHGAFWCTS